jgi:hypothetical protein
LRDDHPRSRQTRKVVPADSVDSTVTVPPCTITNCWAIEPPLWTLNRTPSSRPSSRTSAARELACYAFGLRVCMLAGAQGRAESCIRSNDRQAGLDCVGKPVAPEVDTAPFKLAQTRVLVA